MIYTTIISDVVKDFTEHPRKVCSTRPSIGGRTCWFRCRLRAQRRSRVGRGHVVYPLYTDNNESRVPIFVHTNKHPFGGLDAHRNGSWTLCTVTEWDFMARICGGYTCSTFYCPLFMVSVIDEKSGASSTLTFHYYAPGHHTSNSV